MELKKGPEKITIISLDNWNFNDFIKTELRLKGVEAHHINFNAFRYKYPNYFYKIYNFILKSVFNYNLKRVHLNKHILKRLHELGTQDKILIIKGDNLSKQTLRTIKQEYCTELIAFFNDSFARYPRMKKVSPLFDTVYSFEPKDVESFGFKSITNFIYLPLKKCITEEKFDHDVFNVSSLDKRRHAFPLIATYFRKHNINSKLIAYTKDKDLTKVEGIEYVNKKIGLDKMNAFIAESKAILDLQRPKQEGLSFRVFEALGKHKKLITTNKSIKNYDFYNPNNIAVIDVNNIEIDPEFFKTGYAKLDDHIIRKYHISHWVDTVFNLNELKNEREKSI